LSRQREGEEDQIKNYELRREGANSEKRMPHAKSEKKQEKKKVSRSGKKVHPKRLFIRSDLEKST